MNFKRFLLTTLSTVCMATTMQAVPAYPYPVKVKQANGSYVTVMLKGDEHGHLAMTSDGYPLYFNEQTGNYEYASLAKSDIVGSGIVATDALERDSRALTFLQGQNGDAIKKVVMEKRSSTMNARRAKAPQRIRINDFPTMGDQHSLVILVSFSDLDFTTVGDDPHDFYDRMMNEEGFTYTNGANGSARDFYVASSNGLFTPTFDVVGPVKVSKTQSYYGANKGGDDQMDRIAEMIEEACTLADDSVDFSRYDTNGDGYVDNIFFFYAGYGEADSYKSNTIWPHSAKLQTDIGVTVKLDSMIINSYACSNEINGQRQGNPAGIGTFVHEFGHVLGLDDHYDVYYSGATFTPGSYDTMDDGSYCNNGNTPPLFSAYERGELDWLDYTELTNDADTLVVLPELSSSNKAYRISVEGTNGREFYVLENRQRHGWDEYLPGHGMLMWHIDIDTLAWNDNHVNTVGSHQRVDIVEADNRRTSSSLEGDPFPGTANVTQWTIKSWAGDTLIVLNDIEEKDEEIRLLLDGVNIKIDTPTMAVGEVEDSSFVVKWNSVGIANRYKLSVYEIGDNGKTVLSDYDNKVYYDTDSVAIEGLKPETSYEVTLVAGRGSCYSDTIRTSVQTKELVFEKRRTMDVYATDVSSDRFTANWSEIEDADSYVLTLCKHSFDDEVTERGYDFSQRSDGLPELWEADGGYVSINNCYGESSPSLRFINRGGYVLIAYPKARISSIRFWSKGGNSADGNVYVERFANGEWTEVMSFVPTGDEGNAQTRELQFEQSDSVRIRMEKSNGVFYVDDIVVGCHDRVSTPVEGYENKEVGNVLSYQFVNLEKEASYDFTVRGKQGDKLSYASDAVDVKTSTDATGISETVAEQSDGTYSTLYDLSGRKIPFTDKLPKGIYIVKKDGKSVKVLKK